MKIIILRPCEWSRVRRREVAGRGQIPLAHEISKESSLQLALVPCNFLVLINFSQSNSTLSSMAKDQGLRALLKKQKGVDHKKEHQKKLQKQAEKRKRSQKPAEEEIEAEGSGLEEDSEANDSGDDVKEVAEEEVAAKLAELQEKMNGQGSGWETDESEDAEEDDEEEEDDGIDIEGIDSDSESESDEEDGAGAEEDDEEEEEEDIPLSDIESLASDERGDIIPHQRLTINNTAALLRSLKAFALPASLPFSAAQAVTSDAPTEIKDVEDDLTRELAFYKQSLEAVKEGRIKLNKEGMPFTRPTDYFAEMVKSEEQMGKVRAKMVDAAARKKASADARRQRDLKKFGKAVQVAKLQERDKAKRDTLDKINVLKRSKFLFSSFQPFYKLQNTNHILFRTRRWCWSHNKRRRHVRCRSRRCCRRREGRTSFQGWPRRTRRRQGCQTPKEGC